MTGNLEAPERLRCEGHADPLGIDAVQPTLSWEVVDPRRGARQLAYEVEVASSLDRLLAGDADRWATGRVDAPATAVVYGGRPLASRDRSWWRVRTWDVDDVASPWSSAASFEMGLLRPWAFLQQRDWLALLIRSDVRGTRTESAPAPYVRRTFQVAGKVERARLYITALGLYEAEINGHPVTRDVYRPGWTDYRIRVPYQAFDVTELIREGDNTIGAILGDGWYCGNTLVGMGRQGYGERPALYAQLEVFLADQDDPIVVATDQDWRTSTGPILSNDNYNGETYDARLELDGWSRPDFDDSSWDPVEVGPPPLTSIVATVAPPVRVTEELTPVDRWESSPGVWVFDLGQNMVGHVRLRVEAPEGTEVVLRHAEMLDDDGRSVWTENLNDAKATDHYICRGGDPEVWEPRFTFHGFRYVEVTGYPGTPGIDAVTGVVKHSDLERTGMFTCSHPLVSRLYENIVWGQRGNFLDVPTDCPQRSERLGWTGDIAMFARTAVFSYDCDTFLRKWVTDLVDAQLIGGVEDGQFPIIAPRTAPWGGGPAWADAGILVPWSLYVLYGDTKVLADTYPALERWMAFLDRHAAGRAPGAWEGFGDWVSLDFDPDHPLGVDDRWGGTPLDFLWAAFHAHAADLMGRIAAALGRDHDVPRWRERFEQLREDFVARFVDGGHLKDPTQAACTLALAFDLLPGDALREQIGKDLATDVEQRGHLVTGFVGTPYLLGALEQAGRVDLAYQLLEREEVPGWLFQVKHGATTVWERWDAWRPDTGFHPSRMRSFNHYAHGAVGHWLHRTVGGLDVDEDRPGAVDLRVAPRPGGSITSANTTLHTVHGLASCAWELDDDGLLRLAFTVPPNARARVRLPVVSASKVHEEGTSLGNVEGIEQVEAVDGAVWCLAAAGQYELTITDPVVA